MGSAERFRRVEDLVRCALVALSLALVSLRGLAAEPLAKSQERSAPPRVVVPKLSGPVKLDGRLDEPVWAKAALVDSFTHSDGLRPAREATQLRLWYDDQALYLGWTCQDTNIQASFTNRDSPLYEEDAVELFLTPNELTRYFEFEWSPLGTIFDAVITNKLRADGTSRSFQGDWAYTAKGMRCTAQVKGKLNRSASKDESWQVEVRLPFADLGVSPPRPGTTWRMNAFRINRTQGLRTELLNWSPTFSRSFHEPSRFGVLEFGPPE